MWDKLSGQMEPVLAQHCLTLEGAGAASSSLTAGARALGEGVHVVREGC